MSSESTDAPLLPEDFTFEPAHDDRTALALAAGIIGALIAGGLWALLVRVTGFEIGYAAWGVGLMVGVGMSRVTRNRSRELAFAAAAFATLGLLAGKLFIFYGSAAPLSQELGGDEQMMRSAVAWIMFDERQLNDATLRELDATIAAGDTLSDAVWESMMQQADVRIAGMNAAERDAMAMYAARATLQRMGPVSGVVTQLSAFDLLWIALAVGTAYRMLAPAATEEPAVPQPA